MKNLKDEIRELNIKLKHLLNGFNVPDMEADKIVFEVMKFNERNLTSLIEQEKERAIRKDREAIYKDIKSNYDISADEFFEQYLAERKEVSQKSETP